MRKLILFSILGFPFLVFPKTLLVPEEFLNIQQAVVVAKNSDTVSVNFGRANGQRITVTKSRIFGKDITFELRGEGKNEFLRMIIEMNNFSNTRNDNRQYPPPGWQGPRRACNHRNRINWVSDIECDNNFLPWLVWRSANDQIGDHRIAWTKWLGGYWENEHFIREEPDSLNYQLRPRITFNSENIPYVIFQRKNRDNLEDIFFTMRVSNSWLPEIMINLFDSTELDFGPKVDCNGGELWCCWIGGETDISPYKIYVSHWNGNTWDTETQISPNDNLHHWYCDIAVDSRGLPHVVWGRISPYPYWEDYVCYTTYDGTRWLEPITITDTTFVIPIDWTGTDIAIDNDDNIHVVFSGYSPGTRQADLFYVKRAYGEWTQPICINVRDSFEDLNPDVGANYQENVWLIWSKSLLGSDGATFVTHYDGFHWNEYQLDNDSFPYDFGGVITLDSTGYPWACYTSNGIVGDTYYLYYDKYLQSGISEVTQTMRRNMPSINRNNLSYHLINYNNVCLFDIRGNLFTTIESNCRVKALVPTGIYFLRFNDGKETKTEKIIIIK